MRRPISVCRHAAAYLGLVLMSHAAAIGCAPVSASGPGSGPTGAGKGDSASAGAAQCATSFECPLDQMCSEAGQCVVSQDIEPQERSPMEELLASDMAGQCGDPGAASLEDLQRYRHALIDMGTRLYGAEGETGEYVRNLTDILGTLSDEREGTTLARERLDTLRSLREARDVARRVVSRYDDALPEIRQTEERVKTAALARPLDAKNEALDYLVGLYDYGVRVVVDRGDGYQPHPAYDPEGHEFVPHEDPSLRAGHGLYYIDYAEIQGIFDARGGASHYRYTSRIFQVASLISLDARTLRATSDSLEALSQVFLGEPLDGRTVEDFLLHTRANDFRIAYIDVVNRQLQDMQRTAEEFRDALLEERTFFERTNGGDRDADRIISSSAIVDFARDHEELRARALEAHPELAVADCALLWGSGPGEARGWGLLLGVAAWFGSLYAGGAAGNAVVAVVAGVIGVAAAKVVGLVLATGLLLYAAYSMFRLPEAASALALDAYVHHARPDATEAGDGAPAPPDYDLLAVAFGGIESRQLTIQQASRLVTRASEDAGVASCAKSEDNFFRLASCLD